MSIYNIKWWEILIGKTRIKSKVNTVTEKEDPVHKETI